MASGSFRRRTLWVVVAAAVGGVLFVVVPGWAATLHHKGEAHDLVDAADQERADVLATVDEVRVDLASLGEPVRAWSEVRCRLSPRMSDGETDVVVFYYQECSASAHEVYALPEGHRSLHRAIALLGGESSSVESDCDVPIHDAVGETSTDHAGQSVFLSWREPSSGRDAADECQVPGPGDEHTTRVEQTVDEPLDSTAYVVLDVVGVPGRVDIGCERQLGWLGSCRGVPEGAPYLPED